MEMSLGEKDLIELLTVNQEIVCVYKTYDSGLVSNHNGIQTPFGAFMEWCHSLILEINMYNIWEITSIATI